MELQLSSMCALIFKKVWVTPDALKPSGPWDISKRRDSVWESSQIQTLLQGLVPQNAGSHLPNAKKNSLYKTSQI